MWSFILWILAIIIAVAPVATPCVGPNCLSLNTSVHLPAYPPSCDPFHDESQEVVRESAWVAISKDVRDVQYGAPGPPLNGRALGGSEPGSCTGSDQGS